MKTLKPLSIVIAVLSVVEVASARVFIPTIPETKPSNGGVSIPRMPETGGARNRVGIGDFERRQMLANLVEDVLVKIAASEAQKEQFTEKLVEVAMRERETEDYLRQLNEHASDARYAKLTPEQRRSNIDFMEARLNLEYIVERGSIK